MRARQDGLPRRRCAGQWTGDRGRTRPFRRHGRPRAGRAARGTRPADAHCRGDGRAPPGTAWPARALRGHPIPLTSRTSPYAGVLPGRITSYRPATCAICRTGQEADDQVRRTVIHEIARHFGMDDNRLSELGWQDPDTVRPDARICRRQDRAQRAGRETLAMPTWSAGSRDLCQPGTEADGKPVTESNLSPRAPAQRAADLAASSSQSAYRPSRTRTAVLCRRRVPILTVGSNVQPRQWSSRGGVRRVARKAMARVSDNGPLSLLGALCQLSGCCQPGSPSRRQHTPPAHSAPRKAGSGSWGLHGLRGPRRAAGSGWMTG